MSDCLPYLTVREVATSLRVNRKLVYALCRAGELRTFRVGRLVRIHADSLAEYVEQQGRPAPAVRHPPVRRGPVKLHF